MKQTQDDVTAFMVKAGQTVKTTPEIPEDKKIGLHLSLILEEFLETVDGAGFKLESVDGGFQLAKTDKPFNMKEVYDGLLDINYVNIGTAICCGLDMSVGHNEVQSSNMSKFIDGHRAKSGKWIKGPSYTPANLDQFLPKEFQDK